jgi:hypothetical protein
MFGVRIIVSASSRVWVSFKVSVNFRVGLSVKCGNWVQFRLLAVLDYG